MCEKIDAVIPFVNMNDAEWINAYNNYIINNNIPNRRINNRQRFMDYGSLKYVLRSIELYSPWINNVFLIVQSKSQVPEWINTDTVKIVLHEDFIPNKYLPTFNCNTIETHLHFIPSLSEKFIYFNDDTLLTFTNYPEDYFIGDKCVHFIYEINTNIFARHINNKFYASLRFSNINVLHDLIHNIQLDYFIKNSHGPTPLLKSICNDIYNKINIDNHISSFREAKNLTQELFVIYAIYKRRFIILKNSNNSNKSTISSVCTKNNVNDTFYTTNDHIITINNLFNTYKGFCINDVFNNDILYNEIEIILKNRFPNKCKYEI